MIQLLRTGGAKRVTGNLSSACQPDIDRGDSLFRWVQSTTALHMQLDYRCIFAAFCLERSSQLLAHVGEEHASQKFQPGTPPPCRLRFHG